MRSLLARFVGDEGGQDLVEYAFLAVLIAFVVSLALGTLGNKLTTTFNSAATQVAQGGASNGGVSTTAAPTGTPASPGHSGGGGNSNTGRGRGN